MSEYLRAVPWFAETESRGGGVGGVVVVEERGEVRTVPKGAKAEGVSGTDSMVMVDEVAIVDDLLLGHCDARWWSKLFCHAHCGK